MRLSEIARADSACADGDPQIERFGGQLDDNNNPVDPLAQSTARDVAEHVLAEISSLGRAFG